MDDTQYWQAFDPLWARFENLQRLLANPPLLAHYTSIPVLEKILQEETIWLSNPLFMNDIQEMRFGLNEGARLFHNQALLRNAGGSDARALKLEELFQWYFTTYDKEFAFDTYVFCVSEHPKDDGDGLLSMWRGYGSQGNGAALIFNPGKVTLIPNSILQLATVSYASTEKRLQDLHTILQQWASITSHANLPDDKLYLAANAAFNVIKTYALTSKHSGFLEEREWRLIYQAQQDPEGLLKKFLSHHIGPRGVEPKLKLKIGPMPGITDEKFKLDELLHEIILGPSLSSPLAFQSVVRMLEGIGKGHLKSRLKASTIPLRATT